MTTITFPQGKQFDLVAIGRLCIDLNANEINRPMEETMTFTKYVGGSPANIAIGLANLGLNISFIGKIANDQMGNFIRNYLAQKNIDTSNIVIDKTNAVTGLTFTEIKSPSDCSILMYRNNVADLLLHPVEVQEGLIANSKALLISGTALASSPSREAVFLALDYAVKHGIRIIFDLDYRPYTWRDEAETAVYYNLAAEKCDIIIGTREEFNMMEKVLHVQLDDEQTASKWFTYKAQLVVIKHGGDGSIAYAKDGSRTKSGVFRTSVLKSFGAGDSYASAFIYKLMQGETVDVAMKYGSASAAIVIAKHSCSDAMPTLDELEQKVKNGTYET